MPLTESGLVLGGGLLLADFLAWRFTRVERRTTRMAMRLVLFVGLSYALWLLRIHPFDPLPDDPGTVEGAVDAVLALAWWFQGAHITALIARNLLPASWREERLGQDLASAAVFVVALLGAARSVDIPIRGLLATSGAVAIVVGLAIQSTLSDVFSGLVLNATHPFRLGDLIRIGETEGKVVQRNWRATTLLNGNGNFVVVPNTAAAKADILNFSQPSNLHGVTVTINVPHIHPPGIVLPALRHALSASTASLAEPPPTASAVSIGDRSIVYELVAYAPTAVTRAEVRSSLLELACQHVAAAGVMVSPLIDAVRRDGAALALLAGLDVLAPLTIDELRVLGGRLSWLHFAPGQRAFDGAAPTTEPGLLIIARGVGVLRSNADGREVRRLGPGEAVGRASILTGLSVDVHLDAVTAVEMVRVDKADLTGILDARPEVARLMLDSLLQFQARASRHEEDLGAAGKGGEGFIRRLLEGIFRFHGIAVPHAEAPRPRPSERRSP